MSRTRILSICFGILLAGLALIGLSTPSANAQSCTPSYFIGETGSKDATQVGTQIKITYEIYFQDSVHHYDLKRNTVNDKNTATSIYVFTVTAEQETYIYNDSGPFTSGVTYYYWLQPFDTTGCSQIADWLGPVDEVYHGPTAVVIEDIAVHRAPGVTSSNIVTWTVSMQVNTAGYWIYIGNCPGIEPNCHKLNVTMIPVVGGPMDMPTYTYEDIDGQYNVRYWVREQNTSGGLSQHYGPARWLTGPTAVMIRSFGATSGGFLDHEWIQGVPNILTGGLALSIMLLIATFTVWRWRYFPRTRNMALDFANARIADGKFD